MWSQSLPAHWACPAGRQGEYAIGAAEALPQGWPPLPADCQAYVAVNDGNRRTGFPLKSVESDRLIVEGFPLQGVDSFDLPALVHQGAGR